MEAVQKKVIFIKIFAPRGLETTLFSERESCGAIPLSTSPPASFSNQPVK